MTKEELMSDLTAENFITWVESIPEDEWTIHTRLDENGRRCFHGHLYFADYGVEYPSSHYKKSGLYTFFIDYFLQDYFPNIRGK